MTPLRIRFCYLLICTSDILGMERKQHHPRSVPLAGLAPRVCLLALPPSPQYRKHWAILLSTSSPTSSLCPRQHRINSRKLPRIGQRQAQTPPYPRSPTTVHKQSYNRVLLCPCQQCSYRLHRLRTRLPPLASLASWSLTLLLTLLLRQPRISLNLSRHFPPVPRRRIYCSL